MLHLLSRPRASLRALLALALMCGLALAVMTSSPARAAEDPAEPPAVRWSVTPADASGPDGRTLVEHSLDPGERIEEHFAVRNVSDESVTFSLTAADGFYTRTGRFDILPADQKSVAAGTWISLPEDVTVGAGETVVIPFTIEVPERAEPGDHAAGITASVLSRQSAEDGTSLGVDSRVGFRVLTRVTGELTPAATVQTIESGYTLSWNPLRPGEMTVSFDVVNEGNTRLLAEGIVEAGGQRAGFPAEQEIRQELLPGDTRTLSAVVDDVWPLFLVPVTVTLDATVVTMDGETSALEPHSTQVMVWAVPWPQLIVIIGIALLLGAVIWGRLRSRRRFDAALAEAREEGRRTANSSADER
ncbi:DUF916 domain-containing protein [Agromyces laixinhei]|uniref:DUF916 domain-containing protein n=1 Tax=Agromyces laixinhei TaxID=2585717 RepID=UPI001E28B9C4|nr:DUF916 domain-containing protein [Agromyces laixinhei]